MMTRRPGRSFRKLVKRGTSVRDSLWGKLTLHHKHHKHENSVDHILNTNRGEDFMANNSEPPLGCSPSLRRALVLKKEDNETFGFEIMCNDSSMEDLRVSVSCVKAESPAEKAGMKPGDVLVTVNDVSVIEFAHQQITDTILNAGLIIRLETISAVMAKQMELKWKLWQLKCRLKEKSTELYSLASREEQLTGGKLGKCLLGESMMSLSSLAEDDGSSERGSSGSACGSVDASSLSSAFEDLSFSPLSIRDPSGGEARHSFTFSDSAHSSNPDTPSPLGFPLADGGSSDLSTQHSIYRDPSKGRSKQSGARNRFTSLFSSSRGSIAVVGVEENV